MLIMPENFPALKGRVSFPRTLMQGDHAVRYVTRLEDPGAAEIRISEGIINSFI